MVWHYGYYSDVGRGKWIKGDRDHLVYSILQPVEDSGFSTIGSSKEYKKNWAKLILKIYEVDPPHFFQLAIDRRRTMNIHNMRGSFPLDSQGKTQ